MTDVRIRVYGNGDRTARNSTSKLELYAPFRMSIYVIHLEIKILAARSTLPLRGVATKHSPRTVERAALSHAARVTPATACRRTATRASHREAPRVSPLRGSRNSEFRTSFNWALGTPRPVRRCRLSRRVSWGTGPGGAFEDGEVGGASAGVFGCGAFSSSVADAVAS